MKRAVLLATLCCSFVGGDWAQAAPSVLAPSVLAQPMPSMKAATTTEAKAFRKLYAAADNATLRRDIVFFRNVTPDGYTVRYRSGVLLNKAQYLAVTTQVLQRTIKFNAVRSRIDRIGTEKNLAVVVSTSTVDMIYRGLDNKTHRSVSTSQVMDTWILLKQGWRNQSSQEIATRSTVDGRAYPPLSRLAPPQPKVAQPTTSR